MKGKLPKVVFYRSVWVPLEKKSIGKLQLDESAYYFENSGVTYIDIPRLDVQKPRKEMTLLWMQDEITPEIILRQIENKFWVDDLERWRNKRNAYGFIDEQMLKECVTSKTCATVDSCLLFFSAEAQKSLAKIGSPPDLLTVIAYVIQFQHKTLWHIDKIERKEYADPE